VRGETVEADEISVTHQTATNLTRILRDSSNLTHRTDRHQRVRHFPVSARAARVAQQASPFDGYHQRVRQAQNERHRMHNIENNMGISGNSMTSRRDQAFSWHCSAPMDGHLGKTATSTRMRSAVVSCRCSTWLLLDIEQPGRFLANAKVHKRRYVYTSGDANARLVDGFVRSAQSLSVAHSLMSLHVALALATASPGEGMSGKSQWLCRQWRWADKTLNTQP